MSIALDIFALLFPTARADFRPEHADILRERIVNFRAWKEFLPEVERHGMAPLFYRHTLSTGVQLPEEILLGLRGLVIRHRLAARARQICLVEILTAARENGIGVVLLKGCAMACIAYPEPELRPMRDIDILVPPPESTRLHEMLQKIGYRKVDEVPWDHHHLSTLQKQVDGLQVAIEIHHDVFHFSWRGKAANLEDQMRMSRACEVDGVPAQTLCLEEMLWHTYQHMISGPIRLNAVADMVTLAERYVDEIDWCKIANTFPEVLNVLALFHPHSPFVPRVVEQAQIEERNGNIPLGEDLQGWSHINSGFIRRIGLWRFLYLTFTPSDWWLYLYFGADQRKPIWPYRYLHYPMDRFRLAWQRVWRSRKRILERKDHPD